MAQKRELIFVLGMQEVILNLNHMMSFYSTSNSLKGQINKHYFLWQSIKLKWN